MLWCGVMGAGWRRGSRGGCCGVVWSAGWCCGVRGEGGVGWCTGGCGVGGAMVKGSRGECCVVV